MLVVAPMWRDFFEKIGRGRKLPALQMIGMTAVQRQLSIVIGVRINAASFNTLLLRDDAFRKWLFFIRPRAHFNSELPS